METSIIAVLVGVVSSIITVFVTKVNADKRNAIENITQERKKWRDDMRGATIALRRYFENKNRFCLKGLSSEGKENYGIVFYSAAEAKAFFEVRLNLKDPEDKNLMEILDKLTTYDNSSLKSLNRKWGDGKKWIDSLENLFHQKKIYYEISSLLDYFEEGMSHNLKFDWERAKREIKGIGILTWLLVALSLLLMLNIFGRDNSENIANINSKRTVISNFFNCYEQNDAEIFAPQIPYKYSVPNIECYKLIKTKQQIEKNENSLLDIQQLTKTANIFIVCILIVFIVLIFNETEKYLAIFEWKKEKRLSRMLKDLLRCSSRVELERFNRVKRNEGHP